MKSSWNIKKSAVIEIIINSMNHLFFINDTPILPKQYVLMNLNRVMKNVFFTILKKNNKIRNVNTYLREELNNFDNFVVNNTDFLLDKNMISIKF